MIWIIIRSWSRIAYDFAKKTNTKAYITDPISTDEFHELARISGFADLKRNSLVHALNMKRLPGSLPGN